MFGVDATRAGNQLILIPYDYRERNFDHAPQTTPTFYIHSDEDPNTINTEWISFAHNGTDGLITTGKGSVKIVQTSTSGETLNILHHR